MNNVITTVIGMMLAGSTATMTVNYGGDALNAGLTKATAGAITAAVQVASAIQLYDVQEGSRFRGPSLRGLVDAGYLRSAPPNPAKAGDPVVVEDGAVRMVAVPLGDDASDVCRAVERMRAPGTGCITSATTGPAVFVRV
jgi:hypothetical protein